MSALRNLDEPIIIRYADVERKGELVSELDEIIATNASIHIEQMDDNAWWMLIRKDGRSWHLNLTTKRATISAMLEEDA